MMTTQRVELFLGLDDPEDDASLAMLVARKLGLDPAEPPEIHLIRRSLDARHGRVRVQLIVGVGPAKEEIGGAPLREVKGERRVIIVGDGPAGLFCAYQLARAGVPSVVIDRGKKVQPRRRDLKGLNARGVVNPESNYCFGEGGAGTYSDGKLYTRAHKRGDVRDVLELLALHGAPRRILTDARAHIGSNLLPKVVDALRVALEEVGVEFRFGERVTDLVVEQGHVAGVETTARTISGDAVVVATGHSARDVFDMLLARGVELEAKPFALGVRIEHPQPLINEIQYGKSCGHPKLPAASYRLTAQVGERGVFSFCMCPGGWIVPASTEVDGLVVNGMSLSRRDSPYANSGIVVTVGPEEWEQAGFKGPLAGVELQRAIEQASFNAGGGALRAPATRLTDFLARTGSTTVPESSYLPGLTAGNVGDLLAGAAVGLDDALRQAIAGWGKKMRGFSTEEAVLVAAETRTSAPVRVPRDRDTLESVSLPGLYPSGEGAGYAGGIVSAALDGMRVANAIARAWKASATVPVGAS